MLRVLIVIALLFAALLALRSLLLWLRGPRRRAANPAPDPAIAQARKLLGVREGASTEEVRAAFRDRAARAHPDAGGSEAAMQALVKARDLLLNRSGRKP